MYAPISVEDKKSFIKWFLNHYKFKKRESRWILNYLVNHDEILNNIHFVRCIKFCPRAIIITSQCSDEISFRFFKEQIVTEDADKLFHDIRLNPHEPLYIQLNFYKANQSPLFVGILEENPFTSNDLEIRLEHKYIAKNVLDKSLFDFQKRALKEGIDRALDECDHPTFNQLVNELKDLELNSIK